MKNILKSAFILFGAMAVSCSTDDVQDRPVIQGVDAPVITAPLSETAYVLNSETPDAQADRFVWTAANYNGAVEINYTLEMDVMGGDFSNPQDLGSTTSELQVSVTHETLNNAALAFDAAPDTVTDFDIRVVSSASGFDSMASEVITISLTPYSSLIYNFVDMYLVGEAVASGWDTNNNNQPMWRDPADENSYTFVGYFGSGGFKAVETPGLWQPQWGQVGGVLAGNPGTQTDDPDTFDSPATGYYTFTINTSTLAYSMDTYDESTAASYGSVGLIGDSTPGGWDTETTMTQSTFDSHIWYINNVTLLNGEAKFRANNAWDVNWGDSTEFTGTGTQGGSNIPVTAATYNVWFNDLTGHYSFIPVL